MISATSKLINLLDNKQQRKLFWLIILSILSTIADIFVIASIMPFMAIIANPAQMDGNYLIENIKIFFSISDSKFLIFYCSLILMIAVIIALTIKGLYLRGQIRYALFLEQQLCDRLIYQYLHKPYEWSLNKNTSDIGKVILSEVNHVVNGLIIPVIVFITQLIASIAIILFLIFLDPVLTLSAGIALVLIYGFVLSYIKNYLLNLGKKTFEANRLRFKLLSEAFGAIREVKLYQLHQIYFKNFSNNAKIYFRNIALSQVISQIPRFVVEGLALCCMLIAVQYLVLQKGSLNSAIPVISGFAFAVYRLMPAIQQLYANYTQAQHTLPAVNSLIDELNQHNENLDILKSEAISFVKSIKLENLSFTYPNSKKFTISDLNLTVKKGEFIGIFGQSGEGKSTLLDLFSGLLRPTKGSIKIDDICITQKNIKSWQETIGYVSQNIYLIDDTIEKNIVLSELDSKLDSVRVKRAAKLAKLDQFIENNLKEGYLTKVGERGSRISGGQRQRLGVARALYKNPKLLILDEATSSLDKNSEDFIMKMIYGLKGKVTAIIVSHNLKNLENCDKIYSFEKGNLNIKKLSKF